MTFDEWCASKGYEPRRNGSLYEAWQAAIESRVLAQREPIGYAAAMPGTDKGFTMAVFDGATVPVGTPVFAHPTPDDARDAARYRWLKANCFDTEEMAAGDAFAHPSLVFESDELQPYNSESLDAAIDAMQADKETK